MKIKSDFHIHTHNSCDEASLEYDFFARALFERQDITLGVSDHLHSLLQEKDIAASKKEFDEFKAKYPMFRKRIHFGVEASVMSKWELDKINKGQYSGDVTYGIRDNGPMNAPMALPIDEEFKEKYKIEYVITGVHWPLYCREDPLSFVKEYHREYLYAIEHPCTDIMAHYLWWNPIRGLKNVFTNTRLVSNEMRNEIKHALLEYNKAFEVNLCAVLFSEEYKDNKTWLDWYLGWVHDIQNAGVKLSLGSDCHSKYLDPNWYKKAEELFEHYKIDTEKFFTL